MVLVVPVVLAAWTFNTAAAGDRAANRAQRSVTILRLADQTEQGLVDMETGYRGFLLTGKERFLQPYYTGRQTYRQALSHLERDNSAGPDQLRRWRQVDQMAADWQRAVTEPGIALRRQENSGTISSGQVLAQAATGAGKRRFDAIRQVIGQAAARERSLLKLRADQAADADRALRLVLVAGTSGALGLGLIAALLLSRSIASSVGALASASQRIAAGNFGERIGLTQRDEIGQTAAAFDLMAEQLQASQEERTRAEGERLQLVAEQAARAKAEEGRRHLALLAQIGNELFSSLDYEATLNRVAALAVRSLGDVCIVDLRAAVASDAAPADGDRVEAGLAIRRVAVAHADPAGAQLASRLLKHPPNPEARLGVPAVIRTGRSEITNESLDERWAAIARSEEHLAILRELAPVSSMIVPLMLGGQAIGAMVLLSCRAERRYSVADLPLAEEVARRAALAIDNARLYASERAAREVAEQAVRDRDRFLTIASHELRTPITGIKGLTQLLSRWRQRGNLTDQRLDTSLNGLDEAADRLNRLVTDLLDVSRLRTNRMAPRKRPMDLARLIQDAAAQAELQAPPGQYRLVVEGAESPAVISADPDRLRQVLDNLLANALKYSPAGGQVWISLERSAFGGRNEGELVRVKDQGMGIAPPFLEGIFQPFGRAPNAHESGLPGLGLGLSICREIVELHGGRIWAESEGEGRGTVLAFHLPATAPDEAAGEPAGDGVQVGRAVLEAERA
ncbi:MAG: sensor histidine kinase [Chloroflexota bacterium]